jgi:hypothetical protein
MSFPPNFVLTSSSSQPPRLGGTLVLGSNTGIESVCNRSPSEIPRQGEEVSAHELTIGQQERAKQVCDADRERFRQLYNDELRRKRPEQFIYKVRPRGPNKRFLATERYVEPNQAAQQKLQAKQICDADRERFRQIYDEELRAKRSKQFRSGEPPPGGPNNTFRTREGGVEQKRKRARQEQRIKDDQLRESSRLARQRAWQEQRVKDDELLERYRLERLRDRELRGLRLQQDVAEGCIVAFDGVLPSFLEEEYQYIKQGSADFPERITLNIQIRCIRDYQRAISDASRRLPCGFCEGLF